MVDISVIIPVYNAEKHLEASCNVIEIERAYCAINQRDAIEHDTT